MPSRSGRPHAPAVPCAPLRSMPVRSCTATAVTKGATRCSRARLCWNHASLRGLLAMGGGETSHLLRCVLDAATYMPRAAACSDIIVVLSLSPTC